MVQARRRWPGILTLALPLLLSLLGARLDAAPAGPTARLIARGEARAGGELPIRVEIHWEGRPEAMVPDVPTVKVPAGATLRLGSTSTTFDGTATRWWIDGTVRLPDRAPPFTLGPATAFVRRPDGSKAPVSAPALSVGGGGRALGTLLGQGAGSAVVLLVAGALLWPLVRAQRSDVGSRARAALLPLLDAASHSAKVGDAAAFADLVALRVGLEAFDLSHLPLPSRADLERMTEAKRFGGEGPAADVCCKHLRTLAAAVAVVRDEPMRVPPSRPSTR